MRVRRLGIRIVLSIKFICYCIFMSEIPHNEVTPFDPGSPDTPGSDNPNQGQPGQTHVGQGEAGFDQPYSIPDLPEDYKNSELVTIRQAEEILRAAGVPRNARTIRRYCKKGDVLTCIRDEGLHGVQYNIPKAAIDDYILLNRQRAAVSGQTENQIPTDQGQAKSDQDEQGQTEQNLDLEIERLKQEKAAAEGKTAEAEVRAIRAEEKADEARINDAANKTVIREFRSQFKEIRQEIRIQERQIVELEHEVQKHKALAAPSNVVKEVSSSDGQEEIQNPQTPENSPYNQPGV